MEYDHDSIPGPGLCRRDTPGLSQRSHLNNAGASMMPTPVIDAIVEYQRSEAELGAYEAAATHESAVRRLYAGVSQLVGVREEQVAFVDSGTRAWNAVINGVPLEPGDVVVSTQAEFGSNVVSLLHRCVRTGAELRIVRCDATGRLDLEDLQAKARGRVRLVAATHVTAHRGYVAPVRDLADVARRHEALFVLDACQSIGHLPIDFAAAGCHVLTGTSRKWLRGPRGAGFIVVGDDLPYAVDPIEVDLASADPLGSMESPGGVQLRSDARRFELWERSCSAALGLGAAIDYLITIGIETAQESLALVGGHLRVAAAGIASDEIRPLVDPDGHSAIVGFGMSSARAASSKARLAAEAINVSTMADYDAPWDYAALGLDSVLRVAPHYFTTLDEIDRAIDSISSEAG